MDFDGKKIASKLADLSMCRVGNSILSHPVTSLLGEIGTEPVWKHACKHLVRKRSLIMFSAINVQIHANCWLKMHLPDRACSVLHLQFTCKCKSCIHCLLTNASGRVEFYTSGQICITF